MFWMRNEENNFPIRTLIWRPVKMRISGECLLISSLPGKALRTFVEWQGLPSDSTYVLKAELGKLDHRAS